MAANSANCWILKTEPDVYSIDDLARDKRTGWSGVRNFQAQKNLRAMKVGDRALIYHTGGMKEVVGEARVTRPAYPDPDPETPGDWIQVEVEFVRKLKTPVTLAAIKAKAAFKDLALVKQSRLSVSPVAAAQYTAIVEMAK